MKLTLWQINNEIFSVTLEFINVLNRSDVRFHYYDLNEIHKSSYRNMQIIVLTMILSDGTAIEHNLWIFGKRT